MEEDVLKSMREGERKRNQRYVQEQKEAEVEAAKIEFIGDEKGEEKEEKKEEKEEEMVETKVEKELVRG